MTAQIQTHPTIDEALNWLHFGLQVIPLDANKKTAVTWGAWLADLDAAKVIDHWSRHPNHGIGAIVTNDLYIVDADHPDAITALAALEAEHGLECNQVHDTSKGVHHFYRRNGTTEAKCKSCKTEAHPAGIDVRTARKAGKGTGIGAGMIVLPPTGVRTVRCGVNSVSELVEVDQDFIDAVVAHNDATDPRKQESKKTVSKVAGDFSPRYALAEMLARDDVTEAEVLLNFIDPDYDYDRWYQVGMVLYDEAAKDFDSQFSEPEHGYELFDEWSSQGAAYEGPEETRLKWESFGKADIEGVRVTMRSVAFWAREGGADLSAISKEYNSSFDPDGEDARLKQKPATGSLAPKSLPLDLAQLRLPARQRIYGNHLYRGFITLLNGPGGVSKSIFSVTMAVGLAIGKDLLDLAGAHPIRERRVLMLNNEDTEEEIIRRVQAVAVHYDLSQHQLDLLRKNLLIQSGYTERLRIATEDDKGNVVATKLREELVDYCKQNEVDAIYMDPTVSLHQSEENNNNAIDEFAGILRVIAESANVGVYILHHTRKGGSSPDAPDDASRGASSLVGAVRGNWLLSTMTEAEAKKLDIDQDRYRFYKRLDDGKRNFAPPASVAIWLELKEVALPAVNVETGEETTEPVGVPERAHLATRPESAATTTATGIVRRLALAPNIPDKFTVTGSMVGQLGCLLSDDPLKPLAGRTIRDRLKFFPDGTLEEPGIVAIEVETTPAGDAVLRSYRYWWEPAGTKNMKAYRIELVE